MKKVVGWHSVLIFAILLIAKFSFAQNDIKRYQPLMNILPKKSKNTEQKDKINAIFEHNRPLFLQYIPKPTNQILLFTQKNYPFIENPHEIYIDNMSRRTKTLFFKMKMWQYFR